MKGLLVCLNQSIVKKQGKELFFNTGYLPFLKYYAQQDYKKHYVCFTEDKNINLNLSEHVHLLTYFYNTIYNMDHDFKYKLDISLIFQKYNSSFLNSNWIKEFELIYLKQELDYLKYLKLKPTLEYKGNIVEEWELIPINNTNEKQMNYVALGGTFDHLHPGHKILLTTSLLSTKNKLFCGVMDHSLLKNKKYSEMLESNTTRVQNVKDFLNLIRPEIDSEVDIIYDAFGPTITNKDFDGLIVSKETVSGGEAINVKRKELGFNPLDIVVVELVGNSKEIEDKISSTDIRKYLLENQ